MLKYLNKCQVGLVRAAQAAGVSVHPPRPLPAAPAGGAPGGSGAAGAAVSLSPGGCHCRPAQPLPERRERRLPPAGGLRLSLLFHGGEALAFPQPPSWGRNAAAGGPEEYVPLPKMTLEDDRLGTVPGRVWLWKGSYFKILCDFSFQICRGEMGRKKKNPFWRSTQFSNFSLSETGFHTNTSCLPLELLCFCFPTR